jgi:hypothetical protein
MVPCMAEPYCLAMVLCDAVHRDIGTGKCTLLGTFSAVHATTFPAEVICTAYVAITDAQGPISIALKIIDSEAEMAGGGTTPVYEFAMPEIEIESPLAVVELTLPISAKLPNAGLYFCELHAGTAILMARRLLATNLS